MTLEDDRAEMERMSGGWREASAADQEAMLARLGGMLDYLGFDAAEYQLRLDVKRLMDQIEAGLGRALA